MSQVWCCGWRRLVAHVGRRCSGLNFRFSSASKKAGSQIHSGGSGAPSSARAGGAADARQRHTGDESCDAGAGRRFAQHLPGPHRAGPGPEHGADSAAAPRSVHSRMRSCSSRKQSALRKRRSSTAGAPAGKRRQGRGDCSSTTTARCGGAGTARGHRTRHLRSGRLVDFTAAPLHAEYQWFPNCRCHCRSKQLLPCITCEDM